MKEKMASRRNKLLGHCCFGLAMIEIVADTAGVETGMWGRTVSLCLILIGGFFLNKEDRALPKKPITFAGFLESFEVLPECKKAFRRMLLGVALMISALVMVDVTVNSESWLAGAILAILLGIVGAVNSAAYLKCLLEINKGPQ